MNKKKFVISLIFIIIISSLSIVVTVLGNAVTEEFPKESQNIFTKITSFFKTLVSFVSLIDTNNRVNHVPTFVNNTPIVPSFVEVNKPYVFKSPVRDLDGDTTTINWFLDSDLVSTADEYIFTAGSGDIYTFRNISVTISDGKSSNSLNFSVFVSPRSALGSSSGGGGAKTPRGGVD